MLDANSFKLLQIMCVEGAGIKLHSRSRNKSTLHYKEVNGADLLKGLNLKVLTVPFFERI